MTTRPGGHVARFVVAAGVLTLLVTLTACERKGSETVGSSQATVPTTPAPPPPTTQPPTTPPPTTLPPTTTPPTPPPATTAPTTRPAPTTTVVRQISLIDALDTGAVEAKGTGSGLESMRVSITSKSSDRLQIKVLPGTVFGASSRSVQSMVARDETSLSLAPGETRSVVVDVACINMHLGTPGAADTFSVHSPESEDLLTILQNPNIRRYTFRVQQFAIWTISDNPTRGGYVGLGTGFTGSGPSDDEIQQIRDIFTAAGVSPAKYRALR